MPQIWLSRPALADTQLPAKTVLRERIARRCRDKVEGIGHVNLRVADEQASKRFYRDILGFAIAEEDPDHGGGS